MSGLLAGRHALVLGVATERSYAWHIAAALRAQGATCAFSTLPGERNERRVREAVGALGITDPWIAPCDVARDEDLDALFVRHARDVPRLDAVVHSIAFADREWLAPGRFVQTPRAAFLGALDVSAYSLVAVAARARARMAAHGGGAVLTLSFYGGEKVVPGYNVMGVAKAALEASVRYLAAELGPDGIRVNAISGGVFRTPAAAGIAGFRQLFEQSAALAPLGRTVAGEDVGGTAAFLCSDLARGITGEVVHVDCGAHAMAGVASAAAGA